MKQVFSFILGALLMVAIGVVAQSSGVQIFKPATPRQVMVKHYLGVASNISKEVQSTLSTGWILKSCSLSTEEGNWSTAIVVYEKY